MTSCTHQSRAWGIIPAAGLSRRMGRPKQTMRFGDFTIVGAVARTLLEAGLDGIVVVTRSQLLDGLGLPEDARVTTAINDAANTEMIDSVRIGLAGLAEGHLHRRTADENTNEIADLHQSALSADGVLVVPADMPKLTARSCRKCVAAFKDGPQRIVIATYRGKRGHPIVFPLGLRSSVDKLAQGLRELARVHPDRVHLVEVSDAGVTQDIDTFDEYKRL